MNDNIDDETYIVQETSENWATPSSKPIRMAETDTVKEELKKHYGYIYMTICKVNQRQYIGSHKPNSVKNYIGSSRELWKDIEKYGEENFDNIILAYADSQEELAKLEIEYIIRFNATEDPRFYNKKRTSVAKTHDNTVYIKNKESLRTTKGAKKEEDKDKTNPNYGHKWTEEQKRRLSQKRKRNGKSAGVKNPLYGKKGENAINGQKIVMCNMNTGQPIKLFATKRLILEFLQIHGHIQLNNAIATGLPYKGYIWKSAKQFSEQELQNLSL